MIIKACLHDQTCLIGLCHIRLCHNYDLCVYTVIQIISYKTYLVVKTCTFVSNVETLSYCGCYKCFAGIVCLILFVLYVLFALYVCFAGIMFHLLCAFCWFSTFLLCMFCWHYVLFALYVLLASYVLMVLYV